MIIRVYLVTLFCCSIFCSKAQQQYNLVPNYSFEQYTNCPSVGSLSEIKNSKPDIWYKPDYKFGAYFNGCATDIRVSVPNNGLNGGGQFSVPKNRKCLCRYILL